MLNQTVNEWWSMLPEMSRKSIVSGFSGCIEYGLVRSNLPPSAQIAVESAWREHYLSHVQYHIANITDWRDDPPRHEAYWIVNDIRVSK